MEYIHSYFDFNTFTVTDFELDVVPTPRLHVIPYFHPTDRGRYWGPASWVRFLHGPHVPRR